MLQTVVLTEYDAKHSRQWVDGLGYTVEYGDPLAVLHEAGKVHKHKRVLRSFWSLNCLTCGWDASLMTWEGEPFNPYSTSRWAVAVDKRLVIQAKG